MSEKRGKSELEEKAYAIGFEIGVAQQSSMAIASGSRKGEVAASGSSIFDKVILLLSPGLIGSLAVMWIGYGDRWMIAAMVFVAWLHVRVIQDRLNAESPPPVG